MDLAGKKLITFASGGGAFNTVTNKLEMFIAPTKITPVASVGCWGKPPANFSNTLETSIQEQLFL